VAVNQLRKPQRAGHSSGASADNDDIGLHLGAINIGEGMTKMDGHGDWL
jgi:hypothetical protein